MQHMGGSTHGEVKGTLVGDEPQMSMPDENPGSL